MQQSSVIEGNGLLCRRCASPIEARNAPDAVPSATRLCAPCKLALETKPRVKTAGAAAERPEASEDGRSSRVAVALVAVAILGVVWFRLDATTEIATTTPSEAPALMGLAPAGNEAPGDPEAPAAAQARAIVSVLRRTDESGVLTQVSGPDPRSVLDAFCADPSSGLRLSVDSIVPGLFEGSSQRVGLVRDHDRLGDLRGVVIELDPETRRWNIGNGLGPIAVLDHPPVHPRAGG